MKKILCLFVISVLLLNVTAFACTSILLKATDGTVIRSRSMEYSVPADYKVVTVPRNVKYNGLFPVNNKGLKWTGKYGVVGITFEAVPGNIQMIADGLNEKGLSCGELYFAQSVGYTHYSSQYENTALAPWSFPQWVLSNFATVEEVKKGLNGIVITDTEMEGLGLLPLHYIVCDTTGKSIVIEPINGKLQVSDNPFGCMTNNPSFDWHMTNLQCYLNLGNKNITSKDFNTASGGKIQVNAIGSGNAYLGLPGDAESPSRFIRTVFYTQSATPVDNAADLLNQSIGIMNNFFLVKGFIVEDKLIAKDAKYGYSQWEVFNDLTNKIFYFRSYSNLNIRKIDLKKIDFSKQEVKILTVESNSDYQDLTDKMTKNPDK